MAATARQKCLEVYRLAVQQATTPTTTSTSTTPSDPDVVIAADTIVVTASGTILEKPRSAREHGLMLRRLRDARWHRVLTSVCVASPREDARHPGYAVAQATVETRVWFVGATAEVGGGRTGEGEWRGALTDDVIDAYVATREGSDKAGGYAVQGIAGLLLVEKVDGAVDNVVGLPVRKTLELVERVVWRQDEGSSDEEGDGEDDGE